MQLRVALRFRGYWFSLLAWTMLTFATPLANALAEGDAGWMRICSAFGVQWVHSTKVNSEKFNSTSNSLLTSAPHNSSADCVCLSLGLNYLTATQNTPPVVVVTVTATEYVSVSLLAVNHQHQPRSPPFGLS